jgi:hypothetical protein
LIASRLDTSWEFIFVALLSSIEQVNSSSKSENHQLGQNFFMQIQGKKQMAIYDVHDRKILPDSALEKFYNEGQKITKCEESLFDNYQLFEMIGVYVPVTAPHWVRTLDEISISISINFRTPSSVRRDRVYRTNRMLRKIGLRPTPVSPQANTWFELTKSAVLGAPARIRKLAGK